MTVDDDDAPPLPAVSPPNSRVARQQAEEELLRAKEELLRNTRALAHSLAMMRATLESTTDGILVTDGAGGVTDHNQRFVDMWRLSPEVMNTRDRWRMLASCSHHVLVALGVAVPVLYVTLSGGP